MTVSPTLEDLAYMAGFFDGEGHVGIYKRKTLPSGNGSVTTPYQIKVTITNTDKPILDWIIKRFGGHLWDYKQQRGNRSKAWKWTASSLKGDRVLRQIYPFLKVKRDEAALALEFQQLIQSRKVTHAGHRGAPRVSEEDVAKRDILADKIVALRKSKKTHFLPTIPNSI